MRDVKDINREIKELKDEKSSYNRKINEIEDRLEDLYKEKKGVELYEDVKVRCLVEGTAYLFVGGLKHGSPKTYMNEVIEDFCKRNGFDAYNIFIEHYLDNPYCYVLILKWNDLEFDYLEKK